MKRLRHLPKTDEELKERLRRVEEIVQMIERRVRYLEAVKAVETSLDVENPPEENRA